MDQESQKQLISYIVQKTGVKDQQGLEKVLQTLGEEGLSKIVEALSKGDEDGADLVLKSSLSGGAIKAALGAKLNYIKQLRGQCPEGYEVERFMKGGCVKCKKKMQQLQKESVVDRFKKEKCGGKVKKVKKCDVGSKVTTKYNAMKGTTVDTKHYPDGTKATREVDDDGAGTVYTGRNGATGVEIPGRKNSAKVDSLKKADWTPKTKLKSVPKRYFGGKL